MRLAIISALLFVTLAVASGQDKVYNDSNCGQCDSFKCAAPGKCHTGIIKDKCGCCDTCALEEGQLCNTADSIVGKIWHGFCGTGLECRKQKGTDSKKVGSESTCVCEKAGLVCATDGVTYTLCQMAAIHSKSDQHITEKHDGPCLTRPKIVSSSESESVKEGAKHTLICEVYGYPLPAIEWMFTVPGQTVPQNLPGESEEISISVRGGPEKMQVTGYLQITDFQLKHEGIYECIAQGSDGIASKEISLVFTRNQKSDL